MNLQRQRSSGEEGYAMAALLVTIAIMSLMMTMAMPVWRQQMRREKETELLFRAGQYVHAIELYKRKTANTYPPNIDVLIKGRFLRKKFTDPMTKSGEFRLLTPQELNATPSRLVTPGGTPGTGTAAFSSGQGGGAPASGVAGQADSRLGSGTALTGQGLGSFGGTTPTTPGAGTGSGSTTSGMGGTGAFGQNGTVQVGPIAAVVSTSTDQSIRIFKGRDHYNEWIVTIDDVVPRQFLRQPQTQPGQQPGTNQSRPASSPTSSTPATPSTPTTPSTPSSPIP